MMLSQIFVNHELLSCVEGQYRNLPCVVTVQDKIVAKFRDHLGFLVVDLGSAVFRTLVLIVSVEENLQDNQYTQILDGLKKPTFVPPIPLTDSLAVTDS
jgi:hypothetical protein